MNTGVQLLYTNPSAAAVAGMNGVEDGQNLPHRTTQADLESDDRLLPDVPPRILIPEKQENTVEVALAAWNSPSLAVKYSYCDLGKSLPPDPSFGRWMASQAGWN